jgi:hypothetical protein
MGNMIARQSAKVAQTKWRTWRSRPTICASCASCASPYRDWEVAQWRALSLARVSTLSAAAHHRQRLAARRGALASSWQRSHRQHDTETRPVASSPSILSTSGVRITSLSACAKASGNFSVVPLPVQLPPRKPYWVHAWVHSLHVREQVIDSPAALPAVTPVKSFGCWRNVRPSGTCPPKKTGVGWGGTPQNARSPIIHPFSHFRGPVLKSRCVAAPGFLRSVMPDTKEAWYDRRSI